MVGLLENEPARLSGRGPGAGETALFSVKKNVPRLGEGDCERVFLKEDGGVSLIVAWIADRSWCQS